MKSTGIAVLILTALLVFSGCGQTDNPENSVQEFTSKGIIVSVEIENGIATIDHEEIKGLMAAMTMDFPAKDKSLLNGLKEGDEVRFTLEREGEQIRIAKIAKTGTQRKTGAQIYKESCAKCHGEKGEGARKGIPLIEGHALNHPEEDFLEQVKNGGEKMPSFSDKLGEEEIAAVVKYVRNEIQKGLRKENPGGHKH